MVDEKGQDIKDIKQKSFILKKAEKLSQAVYRVSDIFNDRDDLKWEVRSLSLKILSGVLSFIGKREPSLKDKENIIHDVVKICSFFDVANSGALTHRNHFFILRGEYEGFALLVEKLQSDLENDHYFIMTQEDLLRGEKSLRTLESSSIKDTQDKGQNLSFILPKGRKLIDNYRENENRLKNKAISGKGQATSNFFSGNSERQESIVRFIRERKEVNIKDILSIPDIVKNSSEKTIQRELLRLVSLGVLKKQGERRWSRYSLLK